MTINFCPNCSVVLIPIKDGEKLTIKCIQCNYYKKLEENELLNSTEKIIRNQERGEGISKEKDTLATYNNTCLKYGYTKAQIIDVGILYSDEDNLILLKCGNCGSSERIGRKVN